MPTESFKTVEFKYYTLAERKKIIEGYESLGYEIIGYPTGAPPTKDDKGDTVYSAQLYMHRMDD